MTQHTNRFDIQPAVGLLQAHMTRTIVAKRGNDGIIRVSYIATEQSVDDARENVIAMQLLSPRYPALLLVDTSLVSTVPPAVRSYYLSEEVTQVIGALALLVDSFASRLGGVISFCASIRSRYQLGFLLTRRLRWTGCKVKGKLSKQSRG